MDLLDINLITMQQNTNTNKKSLQGKKEAGRWAADQHQRFMAAIATYGKDWKKVQEIVGTRSGSQVRSHAQKFFNKLLKQQSSKKIGQYKIRRTDQHPGHQGQQSQNSFMKYVHEDGSNTTPIQIVSLIRNQSQKHSSNKVNIKSFQKKLKQELDDIKQQNNQQPNLDVLKRQNSFKSMSNILDAYQTLKDPQNGVDYQNESFLIGLTKKYKKYFSKGGKFQNLIDFGNPQEIQKFQKSIRKRSFTLPQGVQGDEQDINQRKKRVIADQQTAKMTQDQKQSFKKAMELKKQQKQQNQQNKLQQNKKIEKGSVKQ